MPSVETGSNGSDVYVRDLYTNTSTVETVSSTGVQGIGFGFGGIHLRDGSTLSFSSDAPNLVPNDTNGVFDVFAHSLEAPAAPVATDDAYTTGEDTPLVVSAPGVLGNDTDADGDPLTAGSATTPANGTRHPERRRVVHLHAERQLQRHRQLHLHGQRRDRRRRATATVTITVGAVNDAPVAVDDAYTTAEDTAVDRARPGGAGQRHRRRRRHPDGGLGQRPGRWHASR